MDNQSEITRRQFLAAAGLSLAGATLKPKNIAESPKHEEWPGNIGAWYIIEQSKEDLLKLGLAPMIEAYGAREARFIEILDKNSVEEAIGFLDTTREKDLIRSVADYLRLIKSPYTHAQFFYNHESMRMPIIPLDQNSYSVVLLMMAWSDKETVPGKVEGFEAVILSKPESLPPLKLGSIPKSKEMANPMGS